MAFTFGSPTPAAPAGFGSGGASTPAPAPSAFGGFGSTPAPAPAPSSGFGFGAAPSPAQFGAAPAPAPAAPGFSFGATPAPAPAASGFGFGAAAPAPAASGFGGFGAAAPAPAPAVGGFGGFGAAAPAPAPAAGGFGGFGQPQQQQQVPPHMQAQQREQQLLTEKLSASLQTITSAYDDTSPNCRFQHLFYNKVQPSQRHLYTCPPNVSSKKWEEAELLNPDPANLVPAPVVGVKALQERVVQQQLEVKKLRQFLDSLKQAASALQAKTSSSSDACAAAKMEQSALHQRFLQAMRKVEVLRCMGLAIQPGELEFRSTISKLHAKLDRPQAMLSEVQAASSSYKAMRSASASSSRLSEEDRKALFKVLEEQQNGINHLCRIVEKDVKDMEFLSKVEEEERRLKGGGRVAM